MVQMVQKSQFLCGKKNRSRSRYWWNDLIITWKYLCEMQWIITAQRYLYNFPFTHFVLGWILSIPLRGKKNRIHLRLHLKRSQYAYKVAGKKAFKCDVLSLTHINSKWVNLHYKHFDIVICGSGWDERNAHTKKKSTSSTPFCIIRPHWSS